MPQEKQKKKYRLLVLKATRCDGEYVFPGDIVTTEKQLLVSLKKAKIFDEKTDDPDALRKAYEAEKQYRGRVPNRRVDAPEEDEVAGAKKSAKK